jgi:hypothetical protein
MRSYPTEVAIVEPPPLWKQYTTMHKCGQTVVISGFCLGLVGVGMKHLAENLCPGVLATYFVHRTWERDSSPNPGRETFREVFHPSYRASRGSPGAVLLQ